MFPQNFLKFSPQFSELSFDFLKFFFETSTEARWLRSHNMWSWVVEVGLGAGVSDEPSLSDYRYILYRNDTPQVTPKSIQNYRNTDWCKFRSELRDKLNYYNGFRVESKDDLEMVVAMLDTSIRDSFTSSCPEKIIQDKSMWWTNELSKLRKNSRGKLSVALRQSVLEHWESYREAQC